jgi:heterodisulfide reductase subunit A
MPHVFSAGDMVTGPATVIEAVGAGHKVVAAMDRYLRGEDLEAYAEALKAEEAPGREWDEIPEGMETEARAHTGSREPSERVSTFEEVDLGFAEDEARREAHRCLNCGVCCECMECVRACEAKAIDHTMEPEIREIQVGSIVVATGYDLLDPTPMKQFGYGKYPNVMTSLEFERLNNATGPTGGQILMRDGEGAFTTPPESVAIIHCVGSRDENYHEYCSRVCCMYALKYGHLLKDKVGHHIKVYDYYIDMRCFGKGYEEFYRRCQEEGIQFIRGKPAEITGQALTPEEEGKLVVIGEDTLAGKRYRNPVDMVILCAAMEARKDALDVGRVFGINQGADGFFLEEHPKLGPLNTATDGVYLAGACQGPKDIPDTVSQASGAAAKALELSARGEVEISPTISWIDPDVCAGCQTCIGLCAYGAIEFDERRGVSVVNEALCKGCGSCAGFCPSGAAQVKHFNERQVFAELEGIMDALSEVGL